MSISVICDCGKSFTAKDEYAGRRAKCPACGSSLEIPLAVEPPSYDPPAFDSEVAALLSEIRDLLSSQSLSTQSSTSAATDTGPKEYKVLTQKDKWFSGKFDPAKLEEALNAYADQGWIVKAATTASITGLIGGNRDEMIIILER